MCSYHLAAVTSICEAALVSALLMMFPPALTTLFVWCQYCTVHRCWSLCSSSHWCHLLLKNVSVWQLMAWQKETETTFWGLFPQTSEIFTMSVIVCQVFCSVVLALLSVIFCCISVLRSKFNLIHLLYKYNYLTNLKARCLFGGTAKTSEILQGAPSQLCFFCSHKPKRYISVAMHSI